MRLSSAPGAIVPGFSNPGNPGTQAGTSIFSPASLVSILGYPGVLSIVPVVAAGANVEYNVLTSVTSNAIMEWSIGAPYPLGQIRQTALDRTDFAY